MTMIYDFQKTMIYVFEVGDLRGSVIVCQLEFQISGEDNGQDR